MGVNCLLTVDATHVQHLPVRSLVERDTFNRLILRGLVPAGEHTKKEVNTMRKRTITKWWLWGLGIGVGGVILATVMAIVMASHIVDLTAGNRNFVPDSFFWTTIIFLALGGIACCGGSIVQLVAQIGALFNTHHLANQAWFRGLLWSIIISNLLLFVTLGLQFGLGFSGNASAGLVWPGYVVAALIGFVSMVCYLVAGPDGMVDQPGESTADRAAEGARTDGLVQA